MNVGDVIVLKEFSFLDKEGRTAQSNWRYNEIFHGNAKFQITSIDNEAGIGNHGTCSPGLDNESLMDYLRRLAHQEDDGSYVCYWNDLGILENY